MASKLKHKPLWHPALLPSWLVVLVLFTLSLLPMKTKQRLGEKLGRLAKRKMRSRYRVALRNVELCFPDLNESEKDQLIENIFIACSTGFLESFHAWWRDVTPFVRTLKIKGIENLKEAQARGNGVFMIGGHYSLFDFALPLFAHQLNKPGYMYRANDNPVIDWMIERGRRRHCNIQGFTKFETPEMIEFLRSGGEVWYACDQDFGKRTSVFVPFFGVQTGCITMPSKIARESGAAVICVSHLRHEDGTYEITFSPILENFGQDEQQDAENWNRYLEQEIRRFPSQYLWLHKRFKTRPEGEAKIY